MLMPPFSRRSVLTACLLASLPLTTLGSPAAERFEQFVAELEVRLGGRIGVFALDVVGHRSFAYRAGEAFAMCSTFKWLLVAQLLNAVDRKQVKLNASVRISQSDILEYAPVVSAQVNRGAMTFKELAEAAVTLSDNSAANILMRKLGGPEALTVFIRKLGDSTSRLDRIEPELNQNTHGDLRDTTTPRGMVTCMQTVFSGDVLSSPSKELLLTWLRACKTGSDRLRAGIPDSWHAGDKTGTGANHAFNDVAIAFPPKGGPLLIAAYLSGCDQPVAILSNAHRSIAEFIVAKLV